MAPRLAEVGEPDSKRRADLALVSTPREDALMFRNKENYAVSCECIVEVYELLWRWGHCNPESRSFAGNFGFSLPDTIVILKGRLYAWYFISKKDGALLRKTEAKLAVSQIEKKLCPDWEEDPGDTPPAIVATWLPMASQFHEARCHSPHAEFLSASGMRHFLDNLRPSHSGIIQGFVKPHGVSNFLIRTVHYEGHTSICTRTNRSLLEEGKGQFFERAATFEGWPGLSSTCSRYRSHKHPHMEELVFAAGEMLNHRIEQEQIRHMLFLKPDQHVALHFKVTKEHLLYFIYASVVPEHEVIQQTKPMLLMTDPVLTCEVPGAALLRGGNDKKAPPFDPLLSARKRQEQLEQEQREQEAQPTEGAEESASQIEDGLPVDLKSVPSEERNSGKMAQKRNSRGSDHQFRSVKTAELQFQEGSDAAAAPTSDPAAASPPVGGLLLAGRGKPGQQNSSRSRMVSPRRREWCPMDNTDSELLAFIPRVNYSRPKVPQPPYVLERTMKAAGTGVDDDAVAWDEAGFALSSLKQPLIVPTGAHPAGAHHQTLDETQQLRS
mmetsp:Transcript_52984/g.126446  ORF Transcript_52984/g.126446 Transcript_52984/m.126446 type:complete len:552 (+) Transcript_52984:171-1826(+)